MSARSRRKAREAALSVLYQVELSDITADEALAETLDETVLPEELAEFATTLVRGVRSEQRDLDDRLAALITDYSLERVAAIDRNVMRIAAYELFHLPEVPPAVTLNEAVEIAKKYSTAESGKFVNGVLGKLLLDSPKASWSSAEAKELAEDAPEPEAPPEVEVVEVDEAEARKLLKVGGWTLRSEKNS